MDALSSASLALLSEFGALNFVNTAWAFAKLKVRDRPAVGDSIGGKSAKL